MELNNKTAVIAAIWNNPGQLFGGEWKHGRTRWDYIRGVEGWNQAGALSLLKTRTGEGITVLFNHGSGRAGETTDVFTYIQERDGLGGFWDTLQSIADCYKIPLQLTPEQAEQITRGRLAREVFPSLREALNSNPDGEAARYLRETRRFGDFGDFFGELSPDSIKRAKTSLKARNLKYTPADLEALGLTQERAAAGYSVVIPYYKNGQIQGFLFRNVRQGAKPKYMFSTGLKRGFYCKLLKHGDPAYIVEGEMDGIRLLQAGINDGINNVVAMGGAKPGEDLARLLRSHGITSVVYIADTEHDEQGKRKTQLIAAALRGFQGLNVEGEPVIKSLEIVELAAPEGANLNGLKIDADSYGRDHGAAALSGAVQIEAVPAWRWELERLTEWEQENRAASGLAPVDEIQERFTDIYTRCGSPFIREQLKQHVGTLSDILAPYGITPAALDNLDEWKKTAEYNKVIRQGAADLNKAIQEQRDPGTIREIVHKLQAVQRPDSRAEWAAQLSETFADELAAIREQPDTLRTIWEVGTITPAKELNPAKYRRTEYVEFFPADITVICAPTSHGKTMLLFQAAINAVRDTSQTYIYVSCEENKRQLTQRALNVTLNVPTVEADKYADFDGGPCFIKGTRKRTIKAIIRQAPAPPEYNADTLDGGQRYEQLERRVNSEIKRYGEQIRPRLKFIHTEGSAESITENVLYYVQQFRNQGREVGAVFVDYMQLLTAENRNRPRSDELKDICAALHDCATRIEIPVIIAAQLNREAVKNGIDSITVANLGEGADIERIAHDVFLLWQIDKTPLNQYYTADKNGEISLNPSKLGIRSKRLFTFAMGHPEQAELKTGYLYIEQMKARDGITEGWGLFPFDGERGEIRANDTDAMKK